MENRLPAEEVDHACVFRRRHGHDDLMRAVVHCHGHFACTQPATEGLHASAIGRHGNQSSLGQVARRLEPAHDRTQSAQLALELSVSGEDTRGCQREQLAATVAQHRVGLQAQAEEHLIQGPLGVQDKVHAGRGRPELFIASGRETKQVLARRDWLAEVAGDPIGRVEELPYLWKVDA